MDALEVSAANIAPTIKSDSETEEIQKRTKPAKRPVGATSMYSKLAANDPVTMSFSADTEAYSYSRLIEGAQVQAEY